jgi:hypothetical protein
MVFFKRGFGYRMVQHLEYRFPWLGNPMLHWSFMYTVYLSTNLFNRPPKYTARPHNPWANYTPITDEEWPEYHLKGYPALLADPSKILPPKSQTAAVMPSKFCL